MATKRHCCIRFRCSCFQPKEHDHTSAEHDHTSAGAQSAPSDEKAHDPTPAGAQSAPSDEKGHDPTPAGAQRAPSDEKAHDPTPAGAQSAPSDEKGHDPTPAGAQSAPSDEKGHDPTSAGARSSPSAIDSTIENLPGAPKRTEAPISGSNLNVSGAEAQVSESSNVPLISEGENVNANQNVSGPPGCNEAPSSSSSSGAIKSVVSSIRHTDIAKVDGKYVVDVDKLIEHISDLFKLREEHLHQNASIPRNFPWPPGLTKLKKILPFGTDLRNLKELLSAGLQCVSNLKDIISGPVKTLLKDIGRENIATAGLLVVAYTLERFDDLSTNKEKCWDLLKEMCYVATVVKRLKENSKGTQDVNEEEATALLVEGAIMCCTQIDSSAWKRFFETSKIKADLSDIRQKLNVKYMQINIEIGFRVLSAIERKGRSPLSRKYPKHAVGIDKSITDVLHLLECESEEKAVTVILHGFGGMGKTTLADAVFSQVGGCTFSHVRLFQDIHSEPDIIKLQKDILKDLMGPEYVPDIRTYEDGQRELGERLEKVHALIYIDNVLKGDALKKLLPPDMNTAKKVRFLLTARDEHVKIACPRSDTAPKIKIYKMKGIQHPEAMLILKRKIKEGLDDDQFKDIIQICGKIPLMLTLAAAFIGHADNIPDAYSTVMLQKDKWAIEDFHEMRYAFAYDALPDDCKDPLLDICSYFKGWNWDTVEDIVGKDELKMLESRALVTRTTNVVASVRRRRQKSYSRTTNVVASVHDVILTLARQKSEELRLTFNSASKLKEFLKKKAEGIKGIWLSDNKDALEISATTLDFMSKSLRVLQLGIFTKVEGKCREIFNKLVFFEAKITQLPFCDVSKLEQLRYLSYEPNDLTLSKMPSSLRHMELQMPSSLRHMEFDGRSHSHAFQIFSTDLERLGNLRILRLVNFSKLTNLPEGLGDQLSGLQELSLSYCKSIEKLPDSISNLRSLRILKMKVFTSLTELPVNFGSLSSLQELDLAFCSQLKALPHSVEKLSSLTLLNLSDCLNLLNLPPGLGNLTSLVELDLMSCVRLESIPESIGELKQLRVLDLRQCALRKLPRGFCNLSSITHLSMTSSYLEKLPDGFGQLASLKELDFEQCRRLEKLPEGFGQLRNLEVLSLGYCTELRELCNDFHCLSSLHNLDLSGCNRLEKLPEDFHCLTSLQRLNLSGCCELEGRSMDHMVKMNRLQAVQIKGSEQLVKRWAEIQRDGDGLWSFTVISGQDFSMSESAKENIENNLLSELDRLLTNGQKEPFRVSDLPPNTLILVICDFVCKYNFPWPLIEETINEMQIKFEIIYIGSHFDTLPTKVKDSIFVVDVTETGAYEMLHKVCLTLDAAVPDITYTWYLQMHTKMVGEKSEKYRPCWRFLTAGELEEFVVGNSRRYLRLKQLVETNQNSNIKLLTELFAHEGDETTPVFQKNESSRQDPTEKFEQKTDCGVDKLEGKTILLEMRPIKSRKSFYDIRLQSLKAMYEVEKENLDLEIISIPLVDPGDEYYALDLYRQFSREVPWFVLQNSWMVMTSVVKFFFAKHCRWEEGEECEKLYSTINWIIEPNGRIIIYTPSICLEDKGEVFKVLFHYLESESYQVRWGVKASPTMYEEIEKLRKEEWKQLKNMSNLEFLFNHLESAQVKKPMFQGKLICLYTSRDEDTCFIRDAMEHFRDNIYIIHISYKFSRIGFTQNISKSLKIFTEDTTETEGMPFSNLSMHGIVRFAMRLDHLEEEINGMDESDKQLCELKSLLHSVQLNGDLYNRSITFMDEGGRMVATFRGNILASIFRGDRKDRAQRVIKSMMEDFGGGVKEMHDHDPSVSESLIKNMHTAVEQKNMDVYLDSLRNYVSELRGVELYQLLNVNKEAKKWSRPKVTWPTSRSFCMLKDFLSEGTDADWVKDVISRHPEEETKWKPVIKSLLSGIEEANWAVAGLLAVADVLERFGTVSANQIEGSVYKIEGLFILHAMLRLAQYIGQVNQKPGLWRNIKRVATALILECCIVCCAVIRPSKFALFELGIGVFTVGTRQLEEGLIKQCDLIAKAITEGLDESGSLIKQMCAGLGDYLETFCEEESDVS